MARKPAAPTSPDGEPVTPIVRPPGVPPTPDNTPAPVDDPPKAA